MRQFNSRWTTLFALIGLVMFLAGCGEGAPATSQEGGDDAGQQADSTAESSAEGHHDDHDHDAHGDETAAAHNLHGWWCTEHGVPEGECARCDASLVAAFKEKGDWCEEHNRPDSQCFVCEPSRFDVFAARYEAKFGEKPPQPTE